MGSTVFYTHVNEVSLMAVDVSPHIAVGTVLRDWDKINLTIIKDADPTPPEPPTPEDNYYLQHNRELNKSYISQQAFVKIVTPGGVVITKRSQAVVNAMTQEEKNIVTRALIKIVVPGGNVATKRSKAVVNSRLQEETQITTKALVKTVTIKEIKA